MNALVRGAAGTGRVLAGPWPLYPRAIALVAVYGLFVSAGSRTQVVTDTLGEYLVEIWPQWIGVALGAAVVGVSLALAARLVRLLGKRCDPETCRPAYLVTILLASLVSSVVIVGINYLTASDELRDALPPFAVRLFLAVPVVLIVLLAANGVIASVRARLARQETLLAERLVTVRSERSLLLQADEQVRAQASMTLHNDIQAALLRSVVRLEGIRDSLTDEQRRVFDASIDEIETVREERVRALSRVLSPDIAAMGLLQALEELAGLYADVMPATFDFPPEVQERFLPLGEPDELALAVYRIAEQALLNALKHGRSTSVDLGLALLPDGRVRLTVAGHGLTPSPALRAGAGLATINAWLDAVGGSWELRAHPDGGEMVAVIGRAADDAGRTAEEPAG